MDVYTLIQLIEAGDLKRLHQLLSTGVSPNLGCPYTGTTALLKACELDDLAAAELLIAAGADPNLTHVDGYNCYDSTQSQSLKQLLLQAGFALTLRQYPASAFSVEYRCFSPQTAVNEQERCVMMNPGQSFQLAFKLYDVPPPQGEVRLTVEPDVAAFGIRAANPKKTVYDIFLQEPQRLTLVIQTLNFKGEMRTRLFDRTVMATPLAPLVTQPWPP